MKLTCTTINDLHALMTEIAPSTLSMDTSAVNHRGSDLSWGADGQIRFVWSDGTEDFANSIAAAERYIRRTENL